LSAATRSEIEDIANSAITDNIEVSTRVMSLDDAKKEGAMALFGEKYGETVRVVEIGGPWSRELCAGTHVSRSSEVGLINLISESSIGSSNRRIEALVGTSAFTEFATERALVAELTSSLKTPRDQLATRVSELVEQLRAAEKTIAQYASASLGERVPALVGAAEKVAGLTLVCVDVGVIDSSDAVRRLVIDVRDRFADGPSVIALGAEVDGKGAVVIGTNEAARSLGHKSGEFAQIAAGVLGGGGGGRDDIAQGGGPLVSELGNALAKIRAAIAGS
jgi:alanyl-tRNA synthetase